MRSFFGLPSQVTGTTLLGAGSRSGSTTLCLIPRAIRFPNPMGWAAWFETLLGRPSSEETIWLVAEVDGRVVGSVEARLERPIDTASRQLLRHLGELRIVVDMLGSRNLTVAEAWRPS
jgi:hypothetical protein